MLPCFLSTYSSRVGFETVTSPRLPQLYRRALSRWQDRKGPGARSMSTLEVSFFVHRLRSRTGSRNSRASCRTKVWGCTLEKQEEFQGSNSKTLNSVQTLLSGGLQGVAQVARPVPEPHLTTSGDLCSTPRWPFASCYH